VIEMTMMEVCQSRTLSGTIHQQLGLRLNHLLHERRLLRDQSFVSAKSPLIHIPR
jgi:hypothetical protein